MFEIQSCPPGDDLEDYVKLYFNASRLENVPLLIPVLVTISVNLSMLKTEIWTQKKNTPVLGAWTFFTDDSIAGLGVRDLTFIPHILATL